MGDINQRTYHVGNSNQFSLGISIAGDYRSDKADATKASIAELHTTLVADQIGNQDKSYQKMLGYSWKVCCVYNYKAAFMFLNVSKPTAKTPATYKIQEGDTFRGIAHSLDGITIEDLITANPKVDPKKLVRQSTWVK
ncbi:LysM peptidoglycan-binding domain-containing protein [Pseudogracilibacillus auburnensis]|uniref:LysM domain-containing protein n=1 Tax=Pseudogracilibacillus auburnensis TaxID=1494959 RepID=A0A2V3VLH5_9BACI|nr:LysM peptidoglycan-binding domain-containing protein [Pseudogracilibacillus auburnensis]PXW81628.1 LysM domain-containing protein [Pseudogracilibacillus auburnensis]